MKTERFVYRSAGEALNNRDDIMYIEDIEPTREEWIPFMGIWDREMAKIKYPCHLKDILAVIMVAWSDWQDEQWLKNNPNYKRPEAKNETA